MDTRPRNILIYRIGHIGDTVVSLPALWVIRDAFPNARLTLLSDAPTGGQVAARAVLPDAGLIDDWISFPANEQGSNVWSIIRRFPTLCCGQYDTLVYLPPRVRTPGQTRRDLLFFRLAGIRRIIGAHHPCVLPDKNHPLPVVERESDYLLRRLELSGLCIPPAGPGRMELSLSTSEKDSVDEWLQTQPYDPGSIIFGIGPASNWPSKCWPEPSFAELGRRLIDEMNVYPVILGGPGDASLADRLIEGWRKGSNAAGIMNVRQSAALLRRCDLYVGNDTGLMHLAAAVGTKCVAILSAQDWPGRWHPNGDGHTVLRRSVSCEGCMLPVCVKEGMRCLTQITVDDVLVACRVTHAEQKGVPDV